MSNATLIGKEKVGSRQRYEWKPTKKTLLIFYISIFLYE